MDIRDIAKIAGVSSATVSRVLNGSDLVRPGTAEKVRRVIKDLKFFPNSSATTLKYGRSSTYGLIIPDITNPFFSEFIKYFEKILIEDNQEMLLATTDFYPARMQQSIRRMLIRKVEGVALLAAEIETEPIEALIQNRVFLVTMDRRQIGNGLSDVAIDNISGMSKAIEYLKQLRHSKIAYIGGSTGLTISDHRVQAFIESLKKSGLMVRTELIKLGDYRITGGKSAMMELLSLKQPPTAIVTANDLTAIGALSAIHERGYSVPEDFSVIGFDNIDFSNVTYPALTTLDLPRYELAQTFSKALGAGRKDPHALGRQYNIKTALIIRESTGTARRTFLLRP